MSTNIHVVGTIATDPKLIRPSSGTPLCSFRLASDERRYDREKQAWVEGNTNWFGVVSFRTLAGHAHESFHKGDRVIVAGKLRVRKWEKDDKRGTAVEIEAEAIGHDVRWGVSRFDKRMGGQSAAASLTPAGFPPPEPEAAETSEAAIAETSEPVIGPPSESMSSDGFTPGVAAA